MKPVVALSLFNGISGLHLALDKVKIPIKQVYYSEIDKFANKVTEHHYPNDVSLCDVTKWKEWDIDWSSIDIVSAGFPCQSWSVAGQQMGDKDERGMLFWTTLDIIKNVLSHNPNAKFLMENVKMKKEFEEYITYHTEQAVGYVEKVLINSALVSAQNRQRYYWTNFKVEDLPNDKGILLKDILYFGEYFKRPCKVKSSITMTDNGLIHVANATDLGNTHESAKRVYHQDGKSPTLNTCGGGNLESKVLVTDFLVNTKNNAIHKYETLYYRKLTPIEYERLQNVPDNFTSMLSKTQRYKCLGNGWTIDVIAHILKYAFKGE